MYLIERYKEEGDERTRIRHAPKRLHDDADQHIFFFPGVFTFQGNVKPTSGYLKGIEHMLGGETVRDRISMMCVAYDFLVEEKDFIRHYFDPDEYYSHEAKTFTTLTLKPALAKTDYENPFDKEQVSPEELARRATKVTFVGHSYGGIFSQEVCNALREELKRNDYTPEEIKTVIEAFVSINISNTARLDTQEPSFQRYAFCMTNDSLAQRHISDRAVKACKADAKAQCNSEAMLRKTGYLKGYEGMKISPMDEKWNSWSVIAEVPLVMGVPEGATQEDIEKLHHDYRNQIALNPEQQGFSDVVQRVLLNSLDREVKPDYRTMLLRPVEPIVKLEDNVYEGSRTETNRIVSEKIEDAMKLTRKKSAAIRAEREAAEETGRLI